MVRNRYNTPGIIKIPFWQMTAGDPEAGYGCINCEEAVCPEAMTDQAILIDGDIGTALRDLLAP